MGTYAYQRYIDQLFGAIPPNESRKTTLEKRRKILKTMRYLVEHDIAPEFNVILAICTLHGWYVPQDNRTAVGYFEAWPKDYQTDPHYKSLYAAIEAASGGHPEKSIFHDRFVPNPNHIGHNNDVARLQTISNENQTIRGRFLNSVKDGYIFEDAVSWANWGHEVRRPISNFASVADAGKFSKGLVDFFNNISFIGFAYYIFRAGMYLTGAVHDLWVSRDKLKNEGAWQWLKGVFNKNGRIHQLFNDFLWGFGGVAMFVVAPQVGLIIMAVGLGLDVVNQVIMSIRAVKSINNRIRELKAFKQDELARLDTLEDPQEKSQALSNIAKAEKAIHALKNERTSTIIKSSVICTVLVATMLVGGIVLMTLPVVGAAIMFAASVSLFVGYFLVPKLVTIAQNWWAKRKKKSELALGAESENDIEMKPIGQKEEFEAIEDDDFDAIPENGSDIPLVPMYQKAKNAPMIQDGPRSSKEPLLEDDARNSNLIR